MPSKTSFDTSSITFLRSRQIVAERDLYPVLKPFIGATVCINVASIVPTPLLKPRLYWLIDWMDYLTLASTHCSITSEDTGSSKMG